MEQLNTQHHTRFYIRPKRIAFIVNRNIETEILHAIIQFNTSIWGGYYNLFVPTEGITIREDWLCALYNHDPDIIIWVGDLDDTVKLDILKNIQPLSWYPWSNEVADEAKGKIGKYDLISVSPLLKKLYDLYGNKQSNIAFLSTNVGSSLLLKMIAGDYFEASGYKDFLKYQLEAEEINGDTDNLKNYHKILQDIEHKALPIDISRQEITSLVAKEGFFPPDISGSILIITNGLVDDLFLFHGLRFSTKNDVRIIDRSLITTEDDFKFLVTEFIDKPVYRLTLASLSIDIKTLEQIREALKSALPKSGHNKCIPIQCCNFFLQRFLTPINRQVDQFVQINNRRISYSIPKPTFIDSLSNTYGRWVYDMDLSPDSGNRSGFIPSSFSNLVSVLNRPYGNPFIYQEIPIRITRDLLSRSARRKDDVASIVLPTHQDLIESALLENDYRVNEKDNRTVHYEGALNLLGGISNLKLLRHNSIIKLFQHKQFLAAKALTVDEIKNITSPGTDQTFFDKLQDLVKLKALLRGYDLQCPTCGLQAWYNIAEVTDTVLCRGCLTSFTIGLDERLAYRANELFVGKKGQGSMTTILTLGLLYNVSRHSVIWQCDLKLIDKTAQNDDGTEIDVIAMSDGAFVMAECKNSLLSPQALNDKDKRTYQIEELKRQLEREIDIAIRCKADAFFLSTIDENGVPNEISQYIQTKNEESNNLLVRIITRDELISGHFVNSVNPTDQSYPYRRLLELLKANPIIYKADTCSSKDVDCDERWFSIID